MSINPRLPIPFVSMMLLLVLASYISSPCWGASPPSAQFPELPPPQSAAESLAGIRVPDSLRVELVAAEPLVADPIAFAWGGDGKFWVVEMGDYPRGEDGRGKPCGQVKFLTDTDADGRFDKATIFLDTLSFPTSVLPWRGGALVLCAPEIFFAEDTDGDGRADRRTVLYENLARGNPQHRLNGLRYGLDNWIYCANGENGGKPRSVKTGKSVEIGGRDLRIRPDTGELEAVAGESQYGREQDDWGNWYGSNNSEPMYQFVLDEHYLRRNPHLPFLDGKRQVSAAPGQIPIFARSRTLARPNDVHTANRITSACSAIVYRDDLLGADFAGNTFVCEPVHNLIHREVPVETSDASKGLTLTTRRAVNEEKSEFLAATDNWFRPVMIRTGPDGALYIADMYRQTIEHPEWIPPEWQKRLDLRAGHDKGRIYRVVPRGGALREVPRLDQLSAAELVTQLESPNGALRDLVQQRLCEQRDAKAVATLMELARNGKRPTARLHALAALDGMGAITAKRSALLVAALGDEQPEVRRIAVRLAESLFAGNPEVVEAALKLIDDPAPQVRLQMAYALGELPAEQAASTLAKALQRESDEPYQLAALLSSLNAKNVELVLRQLRLAADAGQQIPSAAIEPLLAMAAAVDPPRGWRATVDWIASQGTIVASADIKSAPYSPQQLAAVAGMLDALGRQRRTLAEIQQSNNSDDRAAAARLAPVFAFARQSLADTSSSQKLRAKCVRLLGRGPDSQANDIAQLLSILNPREEDSLQTLAVAALCQLSDDAIPQQLLADWAKHTPTVRQAILNGLTARKAWVGKLFDAVEAGQVPAGEVGLHFRRRLNDWGNDELRDRTLKLLADKIDADRQRVIEAYLPAISLHANEERGRAVFAKRCAVCHRWGDTGHDVGPDLTALSDKTSTALLIAIFDPNRAIESKYNSFTAETRAGLVHTGLLAQQNEAAITLLGQEGKRQQIFRAELEELRGGGKSLMPEGLEKDLTPQELADLLKLLTTDNPPVGK